MPLVAFSDVNLRFRGPPVLDQANLTIEPGERVCLLGRNGTGKTTLLRLLQGTLDPDRGEVIRQQGLRTATLPQEVPRACTARSSTRSPEGSAARPNCWPSIITWRAGLPARQAPTFRPSWAASSTPWKPTAAGACTSRSTPWSRA